MEEGKGKYVEKVWGSELWIVDTGRYCGKALTLNTGYRSSMHYHKNKDETFYVDRGMVLLELDDEFRIMEEGDIQRIRPGQKHRFTGLAELYKDDYSEIIEFSTHHEESDSYRDPDKLSGKVDLHELQLELGIVFRQKGEGSVD
jgi:mannose-6-phosphate isomerase-like protein (cupin superfamily)